MYTLDSIAGLTAAGRLLADQSVSSSVVLVDAAGLSFNVGPNEEWMALFQLDVGAALASTGLQLALNAPAASTINFTAGLTPDVFAASNLGALRTTTIAAALDYVIATQVGVGNAVVMALAWITNGANPGVAQLQFAQSTSSGTAVTLRKGSSVFAQRLA